MPALLLCLLGTPEVRVDGKPIKLGVKPLAVLAYLVLEGRTNRRMLARMLWPGASDALNSLSAARGALVRALGADAIDGDADTLTTTVQCDVIEFRERVRLGDPEAWPMYRGPFLDGFHLAEWAAGAGEEFEEWILEMREALAVERAALAARLAASYLVRGELRAALPYLEVAADAETEAREDATRWLILTLGALSAPDEAAGVYASLTRRLRDELGVEPTEATRAALETARLGGTAACRDALKREFRSGWSESVVLGVDMEVPFVGREPELAALRRELERAREGRARVVLISGEPGAGKTRLARELSRNARDCLSAFGASVATGVPLAALDRVARSLVRRRPEMVAALAPPWRDALARFIPDQLESSGVTQNPELERRGLFEALRALLDDPEHTTILTLDDLQWADATTIEFALHLLRHPPARGLMLVGTLRDTEAAITDLRLLIEPIARDGLGMRLRLGPLEEPDVADLARSFGREDDDVASLSRSTGGNPFYLIELLRAEPGVSSHRLQDLVRARISVAGELSAQVLEVLAILGDGTPVALIRKVSGRSLEEIVESLDALERAALVRFDDDGVRFGHDLTREVVLTDLKRARRDLLELRASRARKDAPLLAASHFWEARRAWDEDDTEAALETFLQAGSVFALRGDLAGGLTWFDRAQEIASTDVRRVHVLTARARVLERHLRYDEAEQDLDRAEVLATYADPVTRAGVWNARSLLRATHLGDAIGAAELGKQALEVLGPLDTFDARVGKANALSNLGVAARRARDLEAAERYHRQALELRRSLGLLDQVANSLNNLGSVLSEMAHPEARAALEEAARLWESLGNQVQLAQTYNNLGALFGSLGDDQRAEQEIERAMAIQQRIGQDPGLAWNNLGYVRYRQGKFASSREAYLRALESKVIQNRMVLETVYTNLAEVELRLGLLDEAQKHLELAYAVDKAQENSHAFIAFAKYYEAELHALRGRLEEAKECYYLALDAAEHTGDGERIAATLARLARLEVRPELAQRALELSSSPIYLASLQAAIGEYEKARETMRTVGDPYEEQRLVLDLAYLEGLHRSRSTL